MSRALRRSKFAGRRQPKGLMVTAVKRLLVGNPLKTQQAVHERLTKKTALAVFSSDALSSTAYATEETLLVRRLSLSVRHMPSTTWSRSLSA